jgi:hypothetical protein
MNFLKRFLPKFFVDQVVGAAIKGIAAWLGIPVPEMLVDAVKGLLEQLIEDRWAATEKGAAISGTTSGLITDARAAVDAVAAEGGAQAKLALERIRDAGDTTALKTALRQLAEQEAKAGSVANKRAAERYRELGAIAFLDDTAEALQAYSKAAELDPKRCRRLD